MMTAAARVRPIKLLVVGGVALIATIAMGTAMLVESIRDRALAESKRELQSIALIMAEHTDRLFQSLALVQTSIAETIQILNLATKEDFEQRMSSDDIKMMLRDKIAGLPFVDGVSLINADGQLINFSRPRPLPIVNISDRAYFKELKSNPHLTSVISEPLQSRSSGTLTIYFARKLNAPSGEFQGLILGQMELRHFEQFFGSIALKKGSSISLFREEGLLLARYPRIATAIGKTYTGVRDALNNEGSTIQLVGRMDNIDRLLAVRRVEHYPLLVSVGMDVEAVFAGVRRDIAMVIAAGALASFLIAVIGLLIVRRLLEARREQRLQLDTALNNMLQGLCMFDGSARLVLFNQRYIDMYGLSPEVVKPGCTIQDLIRHRKETGSFTGDADLYCASIIATIAQGRPDKKIVENRDGRMVLVSHQPIAGGGWVATHEDVTERHRAETLAQQAHARLREVVELMPAGVVFYDAEDRLVLWNRQFDELYSETADLRVRGISFEDMLRIGLARGMQVDAVGREKEWLAERLALHQQPHSIHDQRLSNGRWVRVEDCRTSDGGFVSIRVDITELKRREEELKLQNMRFSAALENMSPGLAMFDSERRLIVCNDRYASLYGLPPELTRPGASQRDILEHRLRSGVYTSPIAERYVEDRLSSCLDAPANNILELDDGRVIAVADRPISDGGWVSTHDDITERRHVQQELARSRKFLDLVIENVPASILVKDASERRYVLINRASEKLLGVPRDRVMGRTVHECFPKDYADVVQGQDDQLLTSESSIYFDEHPIVTPDNGKRIITSQRLVVRDADSAPLYLLSFIEDITERKRADDRILHLANYDALTDLPNRVLFREKLTAALKWARRGEHVAVLYLDLDYFKNINDSLGHPIGDELLKTVGDRLRQCVREIDTVARLGGDEFAIIQTGVGEPADATALVNRIFETVRAPYDLDGHQLVADVSVGIAIAPDDGTEPDQLLKNADLALYGAKADGRGTYRFFEPEMDARMKARRTLESDLREALARGEFELYYQPQLDLRTNEITGCEALLRWRHPERGMISPAEFIPLAEETGLIVQIGEWVVREACATAATWPKEVTLAVNLSPVQFKSQTLGQRIVGALAASGLSARRLELEITETALMQNTDAVLAALYELRGLGVRFAMDDFGTGYSSLSYLRSFPFDKIKIDRSFVSDLADKDTALSIVRAVTSLAGGLSMTTTAEGVETEQQLDMLRAAGCTEMQGYLFSRPKPAAEIARLLAVHQPGAISAA